MLKKISQSVALTTLGFLLASTAAHADIIDDIKERGTLRVGVKADYKPYGYINEQGETVGLEPDLAKEVANKLGVDLELITVIGANRMEFLQQGKIDLIIATMTDKPERRKAVWFVDPNYYSSGLNALAHKSTELSNWEDLRGKPVCGSQAAAYNKMLEQKFGAEIIAFKGTAEARTALKAGNCIANVYDDSALVGVLKEPGWEDYKLAFDTIEDAPWGIAVNFGEDAFHQMMSETIVDWHKSGTILDLETKWGVTNAPFAQKMHDKHK